MNFGVALALLKAGKRVVREGWNGKGMFVYLVGPGRYAPSTWAGQLIADEQLDGLVPYRPYLAIKAVDGMVAPWVASQTDILANDWRMAAGETIDFDTLHEIIAELDAEAGTAVGESEGDYSEYPEDIEDDGFITVHFFWGPEVWGQTD